MIRWLTGLLHPSRQCGVVLRGLELAGRPIRCTLPCHRGRTHEHVSSYALGRWTVERGGVTINYLEGR